MAAAIQPDQSPPPYQRTDPGLVNASPENHEERSPAIISAPFKTKRRAFSRKLRDRDTIGGDLSKYMVYRVTHTLEEALRMAIFFAIDERRFISRDLKTWRTLRNLATTLQQNAEREDGKHHSPTPPRVFKAPSFKDFLIEQQNLISQDLREWRGIWQQGKEPIRRRRLWMGRMVASLEARQTPRGERGRPCNTALIQLPPGYQVQVTIVPSPGYPGAL